jgi:hypothetical protein
VYIVSQSNHCHYIIGATYILTGGSAKQPDLAQSPPFAGLCVNIIAVL